MQRVLQLRLVVQKKKTTDEINTATSATATKMYTGKVTQDLDNGTVTIEWN